MSRQTNGIRSLVCDSNGIIVAEMVYRCMICSELHEYIDDAQRHYHQEHMSEDDDQQPKNNKNTNTNTNSNNNTNSKKNNNNNNNNSNSNTTNTNNNTHNNANSTTNNCSFKKTYSDEEEYDDINLSNDLSLLPDGTPIFDDVLSPSTSMSITPMNNNIFTDGIRSKQIIRNHTSTPNNNSIIINSSSDQSLVKTARKVGGGFVTCEVCGLTKYYSHISRRYGVFSCESCAKFFYRYLLKPSTFTCSSNGNCSLKIDVPGGRCKACLLQACLSKYIIDPKKHPKIFENANLNDNLPMLTSSSSIQVKMAKTNLPPQIKLIPALPPAPKLVIKQENQSLDSRDSSESNDQSSIINGVLVKGSNKRKQQFDDNNLQSSTPLIQPKTRRNGCRECPGCLADDCGQCLYCLDKPKFGGQDVKKQRCIRRRCYRS